MNIDKLENSKNLNYIMHFIFGGIMFTLIYYFSQTKQFKICALIPSIPVLGLYSLFLILINHYSSERQKVLNYLIYKFKFISLVLLFYILIYILYLLTNKINFSISVAFIIWMLLAYLLIIF